MTSTPVNFLLKRSGISSDRPSGIILLNGEPALCFGASDPGLYFEDSAGAVRKVGPAGYGTTAPNSTPAGLAGNSTGELWTDSSTSNYYLKVWTGSAWQKVGAGFADTATSATSAASATVASGAVLSSGVVAGCSIVSSGLPAVSTSPSGSLVYQIQISGSYPSGLYVRVLNGWALT